MGKFSQQRADAGSKTGQSGGLEKVGGRVSAPRLAYAPDPEYSAEGLDAKFDCFCVLSVVVDPNGRPRDIKILQELGHGLDEKAVESVKEWKFEPAMKDGQPVAVQTYVQVQFQRHELFDSDPQEHLAKPVAQSNKIPCSYTQEQLVRYNLPLRGLAKTRAQEQSAERAAQANKMPPYTPEQLAELRAKCVPYINTTVEDLESKRVPLPPHECRGLLEWMRNPRCRHLVRA